jgi:hypothetical protein
MHAMKRKNPLTESFLVQLDVDMENAGLEASLRSQTQSMQSARSEKLMCSLGPPNLDENDNPGIRRQTRPTYGDTGLAAFSKPGLGDGAGPALYASESNGTSFQLPVRTPHASGFAAEMDTSPDNSADQTTPGSSTQSQQNYMSSGTSHTGYSPANGLAQDQTATNDFGSSDVSSFLTGFNGQNYPSSSTQQQPGSVLPQNWSGNAGLNSNSIPSGSTAGGEVDSILMTGGFGDLVNGMSEADWDNVLLDSSFAGWESGVEPPANFM